MCFCVYVKPTVGLSSELGRKIPLKADKITINLKAISTSCCSDTYECHFSIFHFSLVAIGFVEMSNGAVWVLLLPPVGLWWGFLWGRIFRVPASEALIDFFFFFLSKKQEHSLKEANMSTAQKNSDSIENKTISSTCVSIIGYIKYHQ